MSTALTLFEEEELAVLTVIGRPAPQGSKRHVGHGVMIESSKLVRPWRDAVRATAATDYHGEALAEPVVVSMVFTFARPVGHYRTGRNAHQLRDNAPAYPAGPPDLSKLARSTEDALVDAGVLRDDRYIVTYRQLAKIYEAHPSWIVADALAKPGAVIRIWRATRP